LVHSFNTCTYCFIGSVHIFLLIVYIISADRYIAVCHPISSPRFRTPFIARIVSLSAWLTSALLMVPVFLYANTITRYTIRTSIVKEHSHDQIHVYMHTHINDHTHYHHTTIHMTIHTTIYTTIYTTIHKTAHTTITRPYTRLYKRLYTGLYDRTYLLTSTRPGIRPYTRTYGHTHGYYIKSYIWPYTPYSRTHITHGVDTLHSAIHT